MFTKNTLFKFALVPLAVVTLLAQVVSAASPGAAIQPRAFDDPSGDHFFLPPESCRMGIDRLPTVRFPSRGAQWTVGPRLQVVRWDAPKVDPGDEDDGRPDSDNQPPESRCRPGVFLVKDGDKNFRPILIGTGFNLEAGQADVLVPKVKELADDYAVVLTLGRLQSLSEKFTIKAP